MDYARKDAIKLKIHAIEREEISLMGDNDQASKDRKRELDGAKKALFWVGSLFGIDTNYADSLTSIDNRISDKNREMS